ncbi:MAG: alpha/beta hydrolase [Deltaproteobacteria bacterium]|nr:alpha/beta hydrolase [Deltaproteobacteria bacterium]
MRRALLAFLLLGALVPGAACLDLPDRSPRETAPPGAEVITVRAADDRPLDARLWPRDPARLVIYLHEYQRTQRDWWEEASRGLPGDPSAMTFDLRGHGDSGGDHQDFGLMEGDVRAVLAYARSRGYQQVVLVGAGLGGTVALLVARDEPAVTVVGLSAASDFADLDALEAAKAAAPRLAMVAAREDLSARESLEQIARAAGLDGKRALLLPGRAHGRELLNSDSESATRRLMRDAFDLAWRQPANVNR